MNERRFDRTSLLGGAGYSGAKSWIHTRHPGAKLTVAVFGLAAIVVSPGVLQPVLALLAVFAGIAVSKVPARRIFRGLALAAPWLVVVIILQITTVPANRWGIDYGGVPFFHLYGGEVYTAIQSAVRFTDLLLFIGLAVSVTSPAELSYAVESIFAPVAKIGIPVRDFSLSISIALYFVPLIASEADRIIKSQASRGADFSVRGLGLVRRVKTYAPLFVPVLVLALRHAENLARAMEARLYTVGRGRTRLVEYRLDVWSVCVAVLAVLSVLFPIINPFSPLDETIRGVFRATG